MPPLKIRLPASVVTVVLTATPFPAFTVSALNVEAVPENVTEDVDLVAFNVVVPAMLLLFAAVIPSTVILPFVLSPTIRFAAVMFCNSAPLKENAPAPAPNPMVPPLEESKVVVAVPLLSDPVSTMSPPVTDSELLPVDTVLPLATEKLPVPSLSESASNVAAPAEVKSSFNAMPLTALTVTAPCALVPVVDANASVPPDDTVIPLARVIVVPAVKVASPVELKLLFNVMP